MFREIWALPKFSGNTAKFYQLCSQNNRIEYVCGQCEKPPGCFSGEHRETRSGDATLRLHPQAHGNDEKTDDSSLKVVQNPGKLPKERGCGSGNWAKAKASSIPPWRIASGVRVQRTTKGKSQAGQRTTSEMLRSPPGENVNPEFSAFRKHFRELRIPCSR